MWTALPCSEEVCGLLINCLFVCLFFLVCSGYINDGGHLNMRRFEAYLKAVAKVRLYPTTK